MARRCTVVVREHRRKCPKKPAKRPQRPAAQGRGQIELQLDRGVTMKPKRNAKGQFVKSSKAKTTKKKSTTKRKSTRKKAKK